MMIVREDLSEERTAGAEHSFVSLEFETIPRDQGDICELFARPELFQICGGIFTEILRS